MRDADGNVVKMSGSVGNVVNIADLLQRHTAETVRFLLLSTHYRSPIEYSELRLEEVAKSLQGFTRFFERYERITGTDFYTLPTRAPADTPAGELSGVLAELRLRYFANLDDDFNTGGACGVLFELLGGAEQVSPTRASSTPRRPTRQPSPRSPSGRKSCANSATSSACSGSRRPPRGWPAATTWWPG